VLCNSYFSVLASAQCLRVNPVDCKVKPQVFVYLKKSEHIAKWRLFGKLS